MRSYAETAARALHGAVHDLNEADSNLALKRFVDLLAAKGRLALIPRILEAYERVAKSAGGGLTATVVAAGNVPHEVQSQLATALAEKTKVPVEVQASADPGLLGGAVIRYGDILLDDTVKRKLELLKLSMIA
jgi:F-type H+-transporting ATPase subunit delta